MKSANKINAQIPSHGQTNSPTKLPNSYTDINSPNTLPLGSVGWLSAMIGFAIGVTYATYQVATETAQVIGGLVQYPTDNSFYIYHAKLWTLMNQIPAFLLQWGLHESTVSILISGILGMTIYAAFALWVLALSQSRILALVAPAIIHAGIYATGSHNFGVIYPIWILGSEHTYGIFSSSYCLLLLALFALGKRRTAALMLGLAPAVHPSVGMWCFGIFMLALLWDIKNWRLHIKYVLPFLIGGAAMSALSLGWQYQWMTDLPTLPADLKAQYLDAFMANWDGHRQPVTMQVFRGLSLGSAMLILSTYWLARFRFDMPAQARFLLRISIIASALGLGFCVLTHYPQHMPKLINTLMPGRFINLMILAYPAMLIGLLGASRAFTLVSLLISGLAAAVAVSALRPWLPWMSGLNTIWLVMCVAPALLIVMREMPKSVLQAFQFQTLKRWGLLAGFAVVGYMFFQVTHSPYLLGAWVLLCYWLWLTNQTGQVDQDTSPTHPDPPISVGSFATLLRKPSLTSQAAPAHDANPSDQTQPLAHAPNQTATAPVTLFAREKPRQTTQIKHKPQRFAWVVLIAGIGLTGWVTVQAWQQAQQKLLDYRHDAFYKRAHQGQGLLLTGSDQFMVQLKTGRPILLCSGALDTLTYMPESGPQIQEVLQQVYGINLMDPPQEIKDQRPGALLPDTGKSLWEKRSTKQWKRLAKQYGFTDILTYAHWKLKLPRVSTNGQSNLYHIPQAGHRPMLKMVKDNPTPSFVKVQNEHE